jgi:hypothetical protein
MALPPDHAAVFDIQHHVAQDESGPGALGVPALLSLEVAVVARYA